MDAVTTVEKTKKTPVLSGQQKRTLNRTTARKITKATYPHISLVTKAKDIKNKDLRRNVNKLWYEILTNIPLDARDIVFTITKDTKRNGFYIEYSQEVGTDMDTVVENMATEEKVLTDEHFEQKDPNTGSIFGTGTDTMYDVATEYAITCGEDNLWISWDLKNHTKETIVGDGPTFRLKMFVPFHRTMVSYNRFIEQLRDMYSAYDNRNILTGRKFTINVSGFKTPTTNVQLSAPIEASTITWVDLAGTVKSVPDHNGLIDDTGNVIDKLIVTALDTDTNSQDLTFHVLSVGKRGDNPIGYNFDSDRPYLVVYYKGSKQIAFILALRKSSGLISLNDVVVEAEVDKKELRHFLTSTDKFEGISPNLEKQLVDDFRPYLLKAYPDSNVLEVGGQRYYYDYLVHDIGGKLPCDLMRKEWGMDYLNKLSVSEREKLIHFEWASGNNRYDFKFYQGTSINTKTPVGLIESKRKDFNIADRNQVHKYMVQETNCNKVIAISTGISAKSKAAWDKDAAMTNGSGQLVEEIDFTMIDLADIGFKGDLLQKYSDEAVNIIEANKKTKK